MDQRIAAAIELLRAAGTDTEGVEVKAAAGGFPGPALLKSISAFANTGTGLILLGVDEESGFEVVDVDASQLASQLAQVFPGSRSSWSWRRCSTISTVRWWTRSSLGSERLVQAALVHAQFETIHPRPPPSRRPTSRPLTSTRSLS